MEVSILPIATPQTNLAPVARADMRSTADVAALIRNPQPEIPLRIPQYRTKKGRCAGKDRRRHRCCKQY
jgi:hypothetical protein